MADPASDDGADPSETDGSAPASAPADDESDLSEAELRQRVEETYDFENFGPEDLREMSAAEWEAAFDPETWITGPELLDRVETDLRSRVARREVFARVERVRDAGEDRVVAYSDEGYATIFEDGTVEGHGTVLRDVEPTVVLCSMDEYDPPEPPANADLPDPEEVAAGSGELGNRMLQVIAAAQVVVGVALLVAWQLYDVRTVVAPAAALGFIVVGAFLFLVVANARLSDKYRAEEYRNRLRAVGTGEGEAPPLEARGEESDGDD